MEDEMSWLKKADDVLTTEKRKQIREFLNPLLEKKIALIKKYNELDRIRNKRQTTLNLMQQLSKEVAQLDQQMDSGIEALFTPEELKALEQANAEHIVRKSPEQKELYAPQG